MLTTSQIVPLRKDDDKIHHWLIPADSSPKGPGKPLHFFSSSFFYSFLFLVVSHKHFGAVCQTFLCPFPLLKPFWSGSLVYQNNFFEFLEPGIAKGLSKRGLEQSPFFSLLFLLWFLSPPSILSLLLVFTSTSSHLVRSQDLCCCGQNSPCGQKHLGLLLNIV